MTTLLVIRHGITAWNAEGRIQGQSDIPLSAEGRAAVRVWQLPDTAKDRHWFVSPLSRARETATLLGHAEATPDDRLREMHWGAWEGERLQDLRARLGDAMVRHEARGLDLQPPGGESPRELQDRLRPFLAERAAAGRDAAAVCHKGVIRALYALALDWDMTGKPPEKLRNETAHLFRLGGGGQPELLRLNIPLRP